MPTTDPDRSTDGSLRCPDCDAPALAWVCEDEETKRVARCRACGAVVDFEGVVCDVRELESLDDETASRIVHAFDHA